MKVDFLVFYTKVSASEIHRIISESLQLAYEDNYDEPPEIDSIDTAIDIRYVKLHSKPQEDEGQVQDENYIVGLTIDFDTEDESLGNGLVKAFCEQLVAQTENGILHVLKLNDPYLKMRNSVYASELFEIEMKLREAISLIFLDTYGSDFYNLLSDVLVKPTDSNLQAEQMQAHWENEFFFLLFSDYINLNERKLPNNTRGMIQLIGKADDFESFKLLLTSKPIYNEQYADFLASLKTHVDPIEKLRNCVAHNRTIPQRVIDDYETAKQFLLKSIDDLIGYPIRDDAGLFWEEEACGAVREALESANWNTEDGTVEISMDDCDRWRECESYDELVEALEEIADNTASAYMPFEDGDPVFSYDPYSAIEEVLPDYEEQLTELGWDF